MVPFSNDFMGKNAVPLANDVMRPKLHLSLMMLSGQKLVPLSYDVIRPKAVPLANKLIGPKWYHSLILVLSNFIKYSLQEAIRRTVKGLWFFRRDYI